jgi:hypothetical protein
MADGKVNGGPHLPKRDGGQSGEIVSRRRGRPPRQVRVGVSYRASTPEGEKKLNDAIRTLIASMVRERMADTKEIET